MVFLDWLAWITRTNNKDRLVLGNIEIDDRRQSNILLVPIKRTRFVCVTVVPVPWFTVCLCPCCHHCFDLQNMLFGTRRMMKVVVVSFMFVPNLKQGSIKLNKCHVRLTHTWLCLSHIVADYLLYICLFKHK